MNFQEAIDHLALPPQGGDAEQLFICNGVNGRVIFLLVLLLSLG